MERQKIRLLKDWQNGTEQFVLGQLLQVEEPFAVKMIKDGFAELYIPKADDIVMHSNQNGDMTAAAIKEVMEDVLEEKMKAFNKAEGHFSDDPILNRGGYSSMGEFAQDVWKATISDSREVPQKLAAWDAKAKAFGLQEAVGHDGGFLVPTEFRNTLMQNALEASIILPRAMKIPLATSSVEIPFIDETTHVGSVFGGVIVYRPAEAGTKTASQPKMGKIRLNLHKLVGLVYATEELLQDSPISIEPMLNNMFGQAIAFQMDDDFVFGTGSGMALGINNAPGTVSVTRGTGATIVTADILNMFSRMIPSSLRNAVWLAHSDTLPVLASLVMGTQTHPIGILKFNEGGIADSLSGTLLGRPLIFTEHAQTKGTVGDLMFCDWSQYMVAQKAGGTIQTASSIHLKFLTDEIAFRFVVRYDGQPWMRSPLTPKRGANTLGHFINLATT